MSRKNQHGYMKRCGLRSRKEVTKMKLASAIIAEEAKRLEIAQNAIQTHKTNDGGRIVEQY